MHFVFFWLVVGGVRKAMIIFHRDHCLSVGWDSVMDRFRKQTVDRAAQIIILIHF